MQVVILSQNTPGLALKSSRSLKNCYIYSSGTNSFTKALYKKLNLPKWEGFKGEVCFIEAGVTELPKIGALVSEIELDWGNERLEALLGAKVLEPFTFDSYETLKVSLSKLPLEKEYIEFTRSKEEERALRRELLEKDDLVSILIENPKDRFLELLGAINNLEDSKFEVLVGGASSLINSLNLPFDTRVIEGANLDELAAFSKGNYLLPLKSSDLIFPEALKELTKSKASVVYCDYVITKEEPRYFSPSKDFIPESVPIMISKEAWLLAEGFSAQVLNRLRVESEKIHKPLFATKSESIEVKTYQTKLSVIIPSFGRTEFLNRAVDSVLNQTFKDFEVLIITTDDVKFSDPRVRVLVPNEKLKVAAARNFGLKEAKGEFIAYLDDDDFYLPFHLETLISESNRSNFVYSLAARQWEKGPNDLPLHYDLPFTQDVDWFSLLFGGKFPTLTVLHRKSDERFDENLECMEDWDYWLRVSKNGGLRHIPEITCCYSRRPERDGISSSNAELFHWFAYPIWAKHLLNNLPNELLPHFEALLNEHSRQILAMSGGALPRDKELISKAIDSLFIRADLKAQLKSKLHGEPIRNTSVRKSLTKDLVTVVVPLYNGLSYTKELISSLQAFPSKYRTEVIFVDNASSDGTREFLASYKAILNDENRNFAGACNQGAREASGEYIVFLNNDTIVFNDWLSPLIDELKENHNTGAVGNKQIFPGTKRIHHAGVFIDLGLHPKHYLEGILESDPRVNKRRAMTCVTGACFAMRTEEFLNLGGFDEIYRNGYEDNDLCLKIIQSGKKVVYRPDSVIYHHVSKSAGRSTHSGENWRIFISRWGNILKPDLETFLI